MREIKFRAWEKGKMQHFGLDFADCYAMSETVMQFTGLLDKNGKEIYEGDILRHIWDWDVMSHSGSRTFVVEIKQGARYFSFDCLAGKQPWGIEVIGNIYENGDLLK